MGSLLDKRYVRYDNSLVISAFKPEEFEPEIHAATYRCQASNALGSIISRDVAINAGEYHPLKEGEFFHSLCFITFCFSLVPVADRPTRVD